MAHAWLLCVIGSRQRPPRHAMPPIRTGMNHLRACHGLPAPCRACHRLGGSAIAARSQGVAGRTARGHVFCLRVQPLLEILDFRDRGERITQIMQACKWRLDTLYPSIHVGVSPSIHPSDARVVRTSKSCACCALCVRHCRPDRLSRLGWPAACRRCRSRWARSSRPRTSTPASPT